MRWYGSVAVFMWVVAAEADGTRRTITFLITCLLGIALLLTGMTVWYWLSTKPDRRAPSKDRNPAKGKDPATASKELALSSQSAYGAGLVAEGGDAHSDSSVEGSADPDGDWPKELVGATAPVDHVAEVPPVAVEYPAEGPPVAVDHAAEGPPPVEVVTSAEASSMMELEDPLEEDFQEEADSAGASFTDDAWEAMQRSVLDKFHR